MTSIIRIKFYEDRSKKETIMDKTITMSDRLSKPTNNSIYVIDDNKIERLFLYDTEYDFFVNGMRKTIKNMVRHDGMLLIVFE